MSAPTSPIIFRSLIACSFEYLELLMRGKIFSCNRLGRNADKAVAKDIIEMANKSYVAELQKKIQENIHFQITNFCTAMNDILLPDARKRSRKEEAPPQSDAFAVGKSGPPTDRHGEFTCTILHVNLLKVVSILIYKIITTLKLKLIR